MSQPLPPPVKAAPDEPTGTLAPLITDLLTGLGEDVTREGLERTPERVERSLKFLTEGYTLTLEQVVSDAVFRAEGSELVIVKDIDFYSLCEHHLLPFFGRVHIAYLPDRTILGLSKFARIVNLFARRLQVQERLTAEIADALVQTLKPQGVMVVAEASHLCMMMRGVEKQGSSTRTLTARGAFQKDADLRREVLGAFKPG